MTATELRESDAKGRVTLPKGFASATLLFERVGENELRVRKAKVTPLDEAEAPPLTTLQPLSDADRDKFLAALDSPPAPNAALKRALAAAAALRVAAAG
jgi:Protein of unknown function (DUF1778)